MLATLAMTNPYLLLQGRSSTVSFASSYCITATIPAKEQHTHDTFMQTPDYPCIHGSCCFCPSQVLGLCRSTLRGLHPCQINLQQQQQRTWDLHKTRNVTQQPYPCEVSAVACLVCDWGAQLHRHYVKSVHMYKQRQNKLYTYHSRQNALILYVL